jgi:radical SAM superfamily enzyme YgiQ (UPF0313 family)
MRIKLIRPKAEGAFNHLSFYSPHQGSRLFFAAPISLAVVASLTPDNANVEIIDEYITDLDFNKPVDLVGVSIVNSFMASRAYEIADVYHKKGVTVIFGGLHTSLFPKECLKHADAIVIGEAEDVWPHVVSDFKKKKLKSIYSCKKRPDLKNRPMPRWDLVDCSKYTLITVSATRGCPHQCRFCIAPHHVGNKLRHRSVNDVIKEILYIQERFGEKAIWFVDYNFTADKEYAKCLMTALIPLKIKYHCFTNINVYQDEELLELLAASGCFSVSVGIEFLDQKSIMAIHKEGTNEVSKYEGAIKEIRRHGLGVVANFMVGKEYEDESSFESIKRFVAKNNIIEPYIFSAWVFPCTGWHKTLNRKLRDSEFSTCHYIWPSSDFMHNPKFWINYTKLLYEVYSYKEVFKRMIRLRAEQRKYHTSGNYIFGNGKSSFIKSWLRIAKNIPHAAKVSIKTKSIWAGSIALFSERILAFAAWQRISCLKNFLIAYSNIKVDGYAKEPVISIKEDSLLDAVENIVKKLP